MRPCVRVAAPSGHLPAALLALLLLVLGAAGCGGAGDPTAAPLRGPGGRVTATAASGASPGSTATLPQDEGGPLLALPECQPAPEGIDADVPGLLLPEGAVVTEVKEQGPLMVVRGYIDQTPIQVRKFYGEYRGLELFEIEDEIFEAEVLFGRGAHRSYVKAQAQCQQGSGLIVFVGPSGSVPSVGGG